MSETNETNETNEREPVLASLGIDQFQVMDSLSELFDIDDDVLEDITESIKQDGFDSANPVVLWAGKHVIVDGHTRYMAAKKAGCKNIPVVEHEFKDEEEALQYSIKCQTNRRTLKDGDIYKLVLVLDRRGRKFAMEVDKDGKLLKNVAPEPDWKRSSQRMATMLGISYPKVSMVRMIYSYADQTIIDKVISGEYLIYKAYEEIRERRKNDTGNGFVEGGRDEEYNSDIDGGMVVGGKEKPGEKPKEKKTKEKVPGDKMFNTTTDSVEWAKWTWNPVTGCKHGCEYCYAYDFAEIRFKGQKGWENGFEPTFHEDRLDSPKNTVIPSKHQGDPAWQNVFVCSMADLFGEWVDQEWIDKIMQAVKESPQWNYIFLTKNPQRLLTVDFPENCWVGTTVDCQECVEQAVEVFEKLKAPVKFFSCEPMLTQLDFTNLQCIDWLILGGMSGTSNNRDGGQPEWNWVEKLLIQARKDKVAVYFKPNLLARPKEYPALVWRGVRNK